jgi:hypothetical protein
VLKVEYDIKDLSFTIYLGEHSLNIKQFVRFISNLPDCFGNWSLITCYKGVENELDVKVGFAFGETTNFANQDSNFELAKTALRSSRPSILQGEIAIYESDIHRDNTISLEDSFPDVEYVDSRHIAEAAANICLQKGWTKIGIIAHPHHQWRCMMLLKKQGFDVYPIDCSNVSYSPNNSQPWVRGAWRLNQDLNPLNSFIPREVLVRLLFLWKGWI